MTEDEYSEKHLRLRCLELARPLFPTTADMDALLRAAGKLWEFVNAQTATGSDESGSPTETSSANAVEDKGEFYVLRAGKWDPDEIERMKES